MGLVRRNGKAFDSGDVKISYLGTEEVEFKEITYSTTQEAQLNYSGANKATSYSLGKITPEASITLYMAAMRRMEAVAKSAAGRGSADLLLLKPFTISITFFNEDQEEVIDTIYVKVTGQGRQVNGEMGLAYQLPLLCLETEFGV